MKKYILKTLVILSILILNSCIGNDKEEFLVNADVYYLNKLQDGVTVHGIIYYVSGNQSIDSATVTLPETNETLVLQHSADYYNLMVLSPDDEDYSTEAPMEGNFEFYVLSSKGEELYSTDNQEFDNLPAAEFVTVGFDSNNYWMKVTWNEVSSCDGYAVKLEDTDGNTVFESYTISPDVTELIVSEYYNTGNWAVDPVEGTTYKLILQTYSYDDDANSSNYAYSFKEVSIRERNVVWEFN